MNIELEGFENFLASAHPYAETTKRTYRNVIPAILSLVADPATVSAAELLKAVHSQTWGNARQYMGLAATKKYLKWRYGETHPATSAKIKQALGKRQRSLDKKQVDTLLASFNTMRPTGSRDLAIASLAIDTGLRASELCRLKLADTDLEHLILQVIVKGGQWEYAIYSPYTAQTIQHWLKYRFAADGQNYLFTSTITDEGLTPEGLNSIVRQWSKKTGLNLSPHVFRRTFAELATINKAPQALLKLGGRWHGDEMITRYTRNLLLEAFRPFLPLNRAVE